MIKRIKKNWPVILIVLFSFVPLIWFYGRGPILINGLDTNFPLDPLIWFVRRFFVWNDVSNAGMNFSSSTAGIFFHLIQVIPYVFGANLQLTQIISLIFWFSLLVLSSYLFARKIVPNNKIAQAIFVTLYVFNIYIFNTWENVKVANLAVVTALPLLLTIFISYKNNDISKGKLVLTTALVGVIASGAGINPAYFTVILGGLIVLALVEWKIRILFFMLSILLLVNSFWIVSTGKQLLFSEARVSNLSDIGFTNWLDSLSENTSILNVMRLQGAWDWYAEDDAGASLYIPYATNYFHRFPFIVFSIILPALGIMGFLVKTANKDRLKIYFGVLLILGIFFGVGSHSPTGAIYKFLNQHLPFFSFFRSPWYIFTPYVTLSLAGLAAIFLSQKKLVFGLLSLVIIFGNLIYVYPLITGKIFRPGRSDSFFVEFPKYVFDAKEWLNSSEDRGRIIGYPGDEIEKFEWGYSGIESILNLFSSRETIFANLNATDVPISKVIRSLHSAIRKGETGPAMAIAAKLNASTIFYKTDQSSLWGPIQDTFKKTDSTNFGSWIFYKLPEEEFLDKVYIPTGIYTGTPRQKMDQLIGLLATKEILVNPNDTVINDIPNSKNIIGKILLAENSQVGDYESYLNTPLKQTQSFKERNMNEVIYSIDVEEDGSYQPILESALLNEYGIDLNNSIAVSVDGINQVWNFRETDGVLVFDPIRFTSGNHSILIQLNNRNLIDSGNGSFVMENREDNEKYLSFIIKPFSSLHPYLMEFDYKNIYGRRSTFKIEQKNDKVNFKFQSEGPPFSPEEIKFSFYFDPVPVEDSYLEIKPSILSVSDDPLGTKIVYANLAAYKVFTNKMMFMKIADKGLGVPPEIKINKINPTLYQGEVRNSQGSHIVVFSENYSPDWKIKLKNVGGEPIIYDPSHFSANLYANAWFMDDLKGDYDFEIYYEPQRLHNIFQAVSLGTLVLSFGYFIWERLKR